MRWVHPICICSLQAVSGGPCCCRQAPVPMPNVIGNACRRLRLHTHGWFLIRDGQHCAVFEDFPRRSLLGSSPVKYSGQRCITGMMTYSQWTHSYIRFSLCEQWTRWLHRFESARFRTPLGQSFYSQMEASSLAVDGQTASVRGCADFRPEAL